MKSEEVTLCEGFTLGFTFDNRCLELSYYYNVKRWSL